VTFIQALAIHAGACFSEFTSVQDWRSTRKEAASMFRKFLILLLMVPLLVAAAAAGASFPLLFLMVSLLLIALATPEKSEETQE
jgi:hypothetical protein